MEFQSVRVSEMLEVAQSLRQRAAEALDTHYHCLMLRTAIELEELAATLATKGELILSDDEEYDA